MLESLLGVRLILWMGKVIPVPVSYDLSSAFTRAEVSVGGANGDGFQLTFTLGLDRTFDYDLLGAGWLDPMTRVVVGVALGVVPEVLFDGVITHHQIAPGDRPGLATLTVTGRDVSLLMELKENDNRFPNQSDGVIVTRIVADYAQYGLLPTGVTQTPNIPIELQLVPRQHETDLAFIRRLARRNGFVVYTEPTTFGVSSLYWGPETRFGLPQPALTHNLGSATNVADLHVTYDALAPVGTKGSFVEPITKTTIPIPVLPSLKLPPLSASPAQPQRTRRLRDTGKRNPADAATAAVATVSNAADAVRLEGRLDTVRYGAVLHPRRPVGVRGVGRSYDGDYYVGSVRHVIARGQYTQEFSLSREGTGTLLPVLLA